jgi:type IV pilus assembly protein PilV
MEAASDKLMRQGVQLRCWRIPSHRRDQCGGVLLESLIALLVFSVGVIGNVCLQAQTVRHIDNQHYRGEAIHLARSLVARMSTENPQMLADRYDSTRNGEGHREFVTIAQRLPGVLRSANVPQIRVGRGPSATSQSIEVTMYWQMPGEASPHRYVLSAVIGWN